MASASSSEKIFAMKLASNDVKVRNKALKRLKTYISMRSKKKGGVLAKMKIVLEFAKYVV